MRINRILLVLLLLLISTTLIFSLMQSTYAYADYIKWVNCNVSYQVLQKCYEYDVNSYNSTVHYDWIELLAYLSLKNGNNFNYKIDIINLRKVIDRLNLGETMQDIVGSNKYYKYYYESYHAIFCQFLGEFYDSRDNTLKYGLTAYHPIARGYWYSESDDFGNSRNYGFKRKHLGHDLYGSIGAPIIAVEGGTVAELGWNRYGGWRIGIRSHDTKRYYYYAHLKKNKPYINNLKIGDTVQAGQVIGYLGVTGYSYKENTNMDTKPHLHFGMQLIFDESQVDGNGEIWIDVYAISKFLAKNRAAVVKNTESGDYNSINLRIVQNY